MPEVPLTAEDNAKLDLEYALLEATKTNLGVDVGARQKEATAAFNAWVNADQAEKDALKTMKGTRVATSLASMEARPEFLALQHDKENEYQEACNITKDAATAETTVRQAAADVGQQYRQHDALMRTWRRDNGRALEGDSSSGGYDSESGSRKRKSTTGLPDRTGTVPPTHPKKKRKAIPGAKSLREIRMQQKDTENAIPKVAMRRVIRDIANDYATDGSIRFRKAAREAIQVAAEFHMIEIFQGSVEVMATSNRKTTMVKDMRTVTKILPHTKVEGNLNYSSYAPAGASKKECLIVTLAGFADAKKPPKKKRRR